MNKLWVIAVIYRFFPNAARCEAFAKFREKLGRDGVNLAVIEIAGEDVEFSLSKSDADLLMQVKTRSVLWHKERGLNLLAEMLPPECKFVAWIDCDAMLGDDWPEMGIEKLTSEKLHFVQLFNEVRYLSPEGSVTRINPSYGTVKKRGKEGYLEPTMSGSPGFAWLARRGFFRGCGLWDKAIVGGGDLPFADAAFGVEIRRHMICNGQKWSPYYYSFLSWKEKLIHTMGVDGAKDVTAGVLDLPSYHIWHDERKFRLYVARHSLLHGNSYDPLKDLQVEEGTGLYEIVNPKLRKDVYTYFQMREGEKTKEHEVEFEKFSAWLAAERIKTLRKRNQKMAKKRSQRGLGL